MANIRPSVDGLQRLLRSRKPSARSLSTCPVTGTSSVKNEFESKNGKSRPYSEIPGPKMYPLLGSLLDFKDNGASLLKSSLAYYEKYGMIAKQNLTGDEVIIFDPREYIKGDEAQCTCLNVCISFLNITISSTQSRGKVSQCNGERFLAISEVCYEASSIRPNISWRTLEKLEIKAST